jgi:ubiquinone/menaquinone biosynthesis C-methylase UbiE
MRNLDRDIHDQVRQFYDTAGWKRVGDNLFADAARVEDMRDVSSDYRHRCHRRINRYLSHEGKYFLDVASGPIQSPEYLSYSRGHTYRICADISYTALCEARYTLTEHGLADHGLYVQCDIVNLPFKEASIDEAISLHTIYHVAAARQTDAFRELHRVLRPDARAVVVYAWSRHSLLMSITLPYKALVLAKKHIGRILDKIAERSGGNEPELYFHPHRFQWFVRNLRPLMDFELAVWRSVNVQFLKIFVHERLFGRALLALIYRLEEKYPHLLGRFGAYPILIIRKKAHGLLLR